jgi:hypothetical protein
MLPQAAIGETVPLIVVGITLLLVLAGFPFIPRPLALTNRAHRLSRWQTGLMAFTVLTLLGAIAAISYIGHRHFSESCVVLYLLVAAALGVAATWKIIIESEAQ